MMKIPLTAISLLQWMAPLQKGHCFPCTTTLCMMSADIKIKNQLTLPSPRASNASFLGKSTNPDALGDDKSTLGKDQLDIVPNNVMTLVRKSIDDMCRKMSPQEAFELRLQTRLECRTVPCGTSNHPVHVEKGLAYHVTDADWLSPDGAEIRKFIEDDDRYAVDWGNLKKDDGAAVVVFMPQEPLPHMLNEKDDSSLLSDPHRPSDPILLEKANLLFEKTAQAHLEQATNLKKEFRKKLGEICACMSPQDSFTFRLESRTVFEMFSMTAEPEEGNDGLHYDVYHSKCILGDPEFREFVESDGRYTVAWRHMVRAEAISRDYDGVIVFKPNIPLPHMEEGKGE
jgi:hypothetical protein